MILSSCNNNTENNRITIFEDLKLGLKLESSGKLLEWGKPITDYRSYSKADSHIINDTGEVEKLYIGDVIVFNSIPLGLSSPFDTERKNFNSNNLNHFGQNLNLEDVPSLFEKLKKELGNPDYESYEYGPLIKWEDEFSYIKIFGRSHHGSDWAAIMIGKKINSNQTILK